MHARELRAYGWLRIPEHPRTNVVWHTAKPFRLREVLLWGYTEATRLESVCLSGTEQLVAPLSYGLLLAHPYDLDSLRSAWRLPDLGLFQDVLGPARLSRPSPCDWMTMATGGEIRLSVSGPVSDLILVGESPDFSRLEGAT